jgi:hypothetical protein
MASGPVIEVGGMKTEQWRLEQYFGLGLKARGGGLCRLSREGRGGSG